MFTRVRMVIPFAICAVAVTAVGPIAGFASRADDLSAAIYDGVNQLRQPCGVVGDDPRLTVAAQRHADDLMMNGVGGGHIGSDGSSPQARIADAGYTRAAHTSEIVYWGTGSHATPGAALDLWMQSPPHRAVILDCAFTAAGVATAWSGNMMIAVGDFAGP
ncbi:CAP domain-containing protein [Mycobacterium cookii]|nr:CAP domain-containing protein [Mycobacterium cookii]